MSALPATSLWYTLDLRNPYKNNLGAGKSGLLAAYGAPNNYEAKCSENNPSINAKH
jgi:hypothetical protein